MATECDQQTFGFHPLGRRKVLARFDGGRITSDADDRVEPDRIHRCDSPPEASTVPPMVAGEGCDLVI